MFNYNNGALLKEFKHDSVMLEVTGIVYHSDDQRDAKLVIAVGWNQKVLIWEEDEEEQVIIIIIIIIIIINMLLPEPMIVSHI
jgi:hypothetical protein